MHTQKKPSKYISHASKAGKIRQKNRFRRLNRFFVKCTLCASVFALTLLIDSQWQILKPQFDLSSGSYRFKQTSAPFSSLQQPIKNENRTPAAATQPASKSEPGMDSDVPKKQDGSDRSASQSDSESDGTVSKKNPDTGRPIQSYDNDTDIRTPFTNTDEQSFYSQHYETENEIGYSYTDNPEAFAESSDGIIQSEPERLPSELLTNTPSLSTISGDWNLILVNPWNKLPEDYEVVLTPLSDGHSIDSRCYPALTMMLNDCREAGLQPVICSSYRSQEKQESLFQERTEELLAQGYSKKDAKAKAATSVAKPGTSEHQLGLAVDLVDKSHQTLDSTQEYTPVQQWLLENSWKYGFILRYPNDKSQLTGIIYEPWHYRYVGPEVAKEIYERGICLEEYLAELS